MLAISRRPGVVVRYALMCLCMFESILVFAQDTGQKDDGTSSPVTFHASIQGGLFQNFSGGVRTGSNYMSRVHLTLSVDTEKAGLWRGGAFFINGVNMLGGNSTDKYIGDFQPVSRNEAAPERTGLFELWYKQSFGRAFLLIGQHDMNAAFGTSKYGGNSIHSAFGMNPSITPNAGYTFSIYPRTMPAIYFAREAIGFGQGSIALHAAVYAGFSERFNDDQYNVIWNLDGSTHSRFEIHYIQKRGTLKLGTLYHSGDLPSVTTEGDMVEGNLGFYLIADHLILAEGEGDHEQGLGAFFQIGSAPGDQNLIRTFVSAGLNYTGPFPGRDRDFIFLGFLNSSLHKDLVDSGLYEQNRSILELNYHFKIGEHFSLQPDLQYIINPGGNPGLKNAFAGIFRFSMNY